MRRFKTLLAHSAPADAGAAMDDWGPDVLVESARLPDGEEEVKEG